MRAIVVGDGLAGLGAAYTLKNVGWSVTILEQTEYVDGRAATGYLIDAAAAQVTSGYGDYLELCAASVSKVLTGRCKFKLMNSAIDKLFMKPSLDFLRLSDSYEKDDESVAAYSARRLNPNSCRIWCGRSCAASICGIP